MLWNYNSQREKKKQQNHSLCERTHTQIQMEIVYGNAVKAMKRNRM